MQLNAAQALIGGHDGQRLALVCGEQQVRYADLRDQVARAAALWRRRGLGAGDRVAILLPDGIDWVLAFLGTIWAGGVAVGVNPRIPADEWAFVLAESRFRFILAGSADAVPSAYRSRFVPLADWQAELVTARPIPALRLQQHSPAFWTSSSGTTGRPKAIVHAHRSALAVERASVEGIGLCADDRLYASSKLFFCYPLANSLLAGLKIGATVILDPVWPSVDAVLQTVAAQRPTVFFSVPSLYRDLLARGVATQLAEAGVRRCVSAGEALPARLRQAWLAQTGITISNGYGASEILTLALLDVDGSGRLWPAPGVRITPIDERGHGDDAAPAHVHIHIQSPTLALGYWQRPQAQAQSFRDGGYHPADLFSALAGGGWAYAGREDALVKLRGRWVDLAALDEQVAACPGVAEAACTLVADADGVDALALFYVPQHDAPPNTDSLVRHCSAGWPAHQRPLHQQAVAALPRTVTGKLMRRQLGQLLAERLVERQAERQAETQAESAAPPTLRA